jgi:hypothetical protein
MRCTDDGVRVHRLEVKGLRHVPVRLRESAWNRLLRVAVLRPHIKVDEKRKHAERALELRLIHVCHHSLDATGPLGHCLGSLQCFALEPRWSRRVRALIDARQPSCDLLDLR